MAKKSRTYYRIPVETRFWSKFYKNTSTGCWNWHGATKKGYGYIIVDWAKGTSILAHRLSWIIHKGKIPEGLCVCHKCDTPSCMFLGTRKENNQDRHAKNRDAGGEILSLAQKRGNYKGSYNGRAKLDEAKVKKIRSLFLTKVPKEEIINFFKISNSTLWRVVTDKPSGGWNHVK